MLRRAHGRTCKCCDGSKKFRTKHVRSELKRDLFKEIDMNNRPDTELLKQVKSLWDELENDPEYKAIGEQMKKDDMKIELTDRELYIVLEWFGLYEDRGFYKNKDEALASKIKKYFKDKR